MAKDNTYKVKIEADVEGFKKDLLQELKSVNKQVKKESKQTAENATPQISAETLARIEDLESRLEVLSENTGAATKEINAEINALSTNLDNLGVKLERLDGYVRNIKSQTNKPIHSEIISGKAVQQVVDAQSEIQDLKDILDNFWDEQNRRRKNDKLVDPSSINTLKKYSKEASRTVGEVLGDLKDDVENALRLNLDIIFPDTKKAKEIFGKELYEVEFDDFTAAMKEGKLSSEQLSSAITVTKKELKNFFDYSSRVDLLGSGISNDLRTEISNMRGFVQEAITALKTINLGGNTKVSANPITIKLKVDSDENLLKDVNDAIDRISQSKLLHPIKVGLKPADVKNVPKLDKEFVAGKTKEGEDKIVNVDEKSLKTLQSYQAMYEGVDGYITTKQAEIYRKVEQFRQQISNALRVRASIQKPGVDTDDTFYQDVEDILDVIQQTLQQHNFEIHPNLTSLAYDIQEALVKEKFKIDVEPSVDLFTAKNEFVYDGTSVVPVKIVDIGGNLKIPATLTYDDNGDIPKPTLRERTEPTPPPAPPEPPQENKNNMPEEAPPVELDTEAIEAPMEAMKQDSDQELKLTKEQHDIVLASAKRILEATQQRNKIIAENKAKAAPEKEKLAKLEAAQKASEEAKRKGTKQTETEQPQVDPQEMFALRRSIDGYNKEIAKVRSEQDFMNRYVGVDLSQVSDAEELVPLLGKYLVDASATAQEALGVTQEEYDAIRDVAKQMMTFIASTDKTISGKTAERDRLYGQLINARDSEVPQIKSRIARAENSVTKAKLQQQMVANIFGIDSLESFKKLKVDDVARFIGNEILNNPVLVSELNSSKERFQHYVGTPDKGKDKVLAQDQYNYAKLDNVAAKTFIQVLEDARRTLRVEEMSKEQYDSLILGQKMIEEMHNFAQIGKSIQFARPNMKNGKVNFMPFPDTIQNALNTISKTRTDNTLDEILEKIRMLKEALNDPNLSAEARTSTTKELSEWQGKYNKANLNGIMDTGLALLENLRLVEDYTGNKLGPGNSYMQALGRLFASGDKAGVDVIQSMVTPAAQNFANVLGATSKQIFQYFKSFQLVARYVGADGKEYKQSLNYPEARAEKDINLNQKGGWSWKALEQFFYFMQNGELARLDIMHSPNDRAMQMSYNTNLTDAEIVSRLTAQYTQEANKIKQNLDTLFADYGGFLGLLGDKALNATQKVNIAKDILLNDVENAFPELDKSKVVNELTMDIQGGYTNKNMVAALITTYKVANDTTKKYLDELFAEYGGFLTLMQNEAMYAKQKLEAVNKVMFDDGIFNEDINEQSIVTNVEARFAAALKQVYDTVAAGGKADLKDVKTYYNQLGELTRLNVDSIFFNDNLSLGVWLEKLEKTNWDTDKKITTLKQNLANFHVVNKDGEINSDVQNTLLTSTIGKQILAHLQNLFDDTKNPNSEYAQLTQKYEQLPGYSKKTISRVMNDGGFGGILDDKGQSDDQKWQTIADKIFSNGKLTGQLQNVLTNINLENSILTRIYNVINQFLGERKNLSRTSQQQLLNPGKYKKGSIAFTPAPIVPRTSEQSPEWTEAGSAAWRTQKPKQTGIVSTITDLYTDDLKYQAEKKALEEKQIQLENEVDDTNKRLIGYLDDVTKILSTEFDFDFKNILEHSKIFRERRQKESLRNNWNEDIAEKLLSAYFGEIKAAQIRSTWNGDIPEDFASVLFSGRQQEARDRETSIRRILPRSLDEFLKYKSTTKGAINTGESLQEGFARRLNEYLLNKRNNLTNKKDIASEELAALKLLVNMYQTAKTNNPDSILGEMTRGLVSQYRTAIKVAGTDKNRQTLVNNRFALMRNMFQQLTNGFKDFSAFEFDPKNYAIESLKQNRKQYIDVNGGLEQAQAKLAQSGENYQAGVNSLVQMLVAESETAQQAIDKAQVEFNQQFAGKNRSALDETMQDSWDKAQEKIKKAISKKQAIDGQISILNEELSNKKDVNLKSTSTDSLLAISEASAIEKNIEPWMQRLKQEEELKKQMEEKLANASEYQRTSWEQQAAKYSSIKPRYERLLNDFNSDTQLAINNLIAENEQEIAEFIKNAFIKQEKEIVEQTAKIKKDYAEKIDQTPDNREVLLQEQDQSINAARTQIEKKYSSLITKKYAKLQKSQQAKIQRFNEEREKLWQERLKSFSLEDSTEAEIWRAALDGMVDPKEWLANQEDVVQYLVQNGRKSVRENFRQKIMDEIAKKNASTAKSNDLLVQEQNRIKDGVSAVQARMNTLEEDTNLNIDAELQVEANNIKNTFGEWIVAVARKADEQLRAKLFNALETAYQTKDISALQDIITEYEDVLGNIYTQNPNIISLGKGEELYNFFSRIREILDIITNYTESIKVPGREGNKQPVKGFTSTRTQAAVSLSEVNAELDQMEQQKPDTRLMNYLLWAYRRAPVYKAKGAENQYDLGKDRIKELDTDIENINRDIETTKNEKLGPEQILQQRQKEAEKQSKKVVEISKAIKTINNQITEKEKFITEKETALAQALKEIETSTDDDFKQTKTTEVEDLRQEIANARKEHGDLVGKKADKDIEYQNEYNAYQEKQSAVEEAEQVVKKYDGEIKSLEEEIKLRDAEKAILEERLENLRLQLIQKGNKELITDADYENAYKETQTLKHDLDIYKARSQEAGEEVKTLQNEIASVEQDRKDNRYRQYIGAKHTEIAKRIKIEEAQDIAAKREWARQNGININEFERDLANKIGARAWREAEARAADPNDKSILSKEDWLGWQKQRLEAAQTRQTEANDMQLKLKAELTNVADWFGMTLDDLKLKFADIHKKSMVGTVEGAQTRQMRENQNKPQPTEDSSTLPPINNADINITNANVNLGGAANRGQTKGDATPISDEAQSALGALRTALDDLSRGASFDDLEMNSGDVYQALAKVEKGQISNSLSQILGISGRELDEAVQDFMMDVLTSLSQTEFEKFANDRLNNSNKKSIFMQKFEEMYGQPETPSPSQSAVPTQYPEQQIQLGNVDAGDLVITAQNVTINSSASTKTSEDLYKETVAKTNRWIDKQDLSSLDSILAPIEQMKSVITDKTADATMIVKARWALSELLRKYQKTHEGSNADGTMSRGDLKAAMNGSDNETLAWAAKFYHNGYIGPDSLTKNLAETIKPSVATGDGDWAKETTLIKTNEILNQIVEALKTKRNVGSAGKDSEPQKENSAKEISAPGKLKTTVEETVKKLNEGKDDNEKFAVVAQTYDDKAKKLTQTLVNAKEEARQIIYTFKEIDEPIDVATKEIFNFSAVTKRAFKEVGNTATTLREDFNGILSPDNAKVGEYEQAVQELQEELNKTGENGVTDIETANRIENLTLKVKQLRTEIQGMIKEAKNAPENIGDDVVRSELEKNAELTLATGNYAGYTLVGETFDEKNKQLTQKLQDANGKTLQLTYTFQGLGKQAKVTAKEMYNFGSVLVKATKEAGANANTLEQQMNGFFVNPTKMSQYNTAKQELQRLLQEANTNGITDSSTADKITQQTEAVAKLRSEIQSMIKEAQKAKENAYAIDVIGKGDKQTPDAIKQKMIEAAEAYNKASIEVKDFKEKKDALTGTTYKLVYAIETEKGQVTIATDEFDMMSNSIRRLGSDTQSTTGFFDNFFRGLKAKVGQLLQYYSASEMIRRSFYQIRQGVQYVREIDLALTELKKVTDETDESYQRFLKDMSKTASAVGSTVKELVNSSADWARLGYSMKEAGELAQTTAVLLNVSEFESVDDATSALVSTLQAFTKDGEDVGKRAEEIVDVLNNVGKYIAQAI